MRPEAELVRPCPQGSILDEDTWALCFLLFKYRFTVWWRHDEPAWLPVILSLGSKCFDALTCDRSIHALLLQAPDCRVTSAYIYRRPFSQLLQSYGGRGPGVIRIRLREEAGPRAWDSEFRLAGATTRRWKPNRCANCRLPFQKTKTGSPRKVVGCRSRMGLTTAHVGV